MKTIVIENFWTPTVCTDENGEILEFDTLEEAKEYAEEYCQNGTAVEVN